MFNSLLSSKRTVLLLTPKSLDRPRKYTLIAGFNNSFVSRVKLILLEKIGFNVKIRREVTRLRRS